MTTWRPDGGEHEVLSQGRESPRGSRARAGLGALACLTLGALVGAQVDDAFDDRRAAEELAAVPPVLSAGVIQESPDPVGERRFAVPLHNGGRVQVAVDSVTAEGWASREARPATVTIPAGGWVMVPLLAHVDCDAIGATAPERLTVRSTTAQGTFEQVVSMPAPSRVLDDEGSRLCLEPVGSAPTRDEVVGTWYVEEAGRFRGTTLRLRADGTFAIDPDLYRFGPVLDALGRFTGTGATLRLTASGGHYCRPGDHARWDLTLLEDGRLHIRHRPDHATWCGIVAGEVWIARRA